MRIKSVGGFLAVFGLVLALSGCTESPTELRGKGATFPAPLYARWVAMFNRAHPEIEATYSAVGSGAGIRAITERTAHFGASDALLTETQINRLPGELLTLPVALGPVVLAYNLPDLDGELILDDQAVAEIYLGRITRWNDPKLSALNPGVDLPDAAIHVAHRSDNSGTTFIFTDYLSAVSRTWRDEVGKGVTVKWPTGDDWAGVGNDGVAHRILLLPGGIGYLEIKYAKNAGLDYAALVNREGKIVWPSVRSVQQAESHALGGSDNFLKPSIVNAPGEESYPISGYTYLLVYKDLRYLANPEEQRALVTFLKWALTEGQSMAAELHYAPLPERLRIHALAMIEGIELSDGPNK
jgi:phosphate transport system substrate-binding protein